ncbi:metal-dependent phosphohydrolase HD sub domain protein [Sphaerochaeta globosa str. Buddy]|uniref:Metal-dependent phosphohydrolase HD sub domain protein n=2 Tax=Sphaerochaeta TaxID=399320 RepID=F0RTU2_SPHGB|nr:metal-dependent phosphohydrolase HD sub domain protein [Sphaerochaeta globosa str. Buddy]
MLSSGTIGDLFVVPDMIMILEKLRLGDYGMRKGIRMDTALITAISKLVEHACASEQNKIGYEIWKYHIKPMVPLAQELAGVQKADEEIVTLAVLLHDLAGIEDFSQRKLHHSFGAQRAREILAGYQYPIDKIELVAQCIFNHRADLNLPKQSPEEYCVADADMLINIVDIPSLFYDSYHQEHLGFAEGKTWRQSTLELYWGHVSMISQAQFLDRFNLVKRLSLGNDREPYSFTSDLERTLADLVKKACLSEKNAYGYGIWENHIAPMVTIANELAQLHSADAEVVRIATLLHDLSSIEDYSKAKEHHIHGAQRARGLLREAGYPVKKTELVAQCILHHRASVLMQKLTAEEQCLADADAVAHMGDLPSLFFVAYDKQGMTFEEGQRWVKQKLERDWQKMSEIAKHRYAEQYAGIMSCFSI